MPVTIAAPTRVASLAMCSAALACSGGVDTRSVQASGGASAQEGGAFDDATIDADASIACGPLDVTVRVQGTVLVWRDAARSLRHQGAYLESQWSGLCHQLATEWGVDASETGVAGACAPVNARVAAALAAGVEVSFVPWVREDVFPLGELAKHQAFCAVAAGCDVRSACPKDQWMTNCNSGMCEGLCQSSSEVCAGECTGMCDTYVGGPCDGWCLGWCVDDAPWTGNCSTGCEASFVGSCTGTCQGMCDGAPSNADCAGLCEGACSGEASGTCGAACTGDFEGHCQTCHGTCWTGTGACQGHCAGTCASPSGGCNGICTGQCASAPFSACAGALSCPADPNCLAACEGFKSSASAGFAQVLVSGDKKMYQALHAHAADLAAAMGTIELVDQRIQGLDGALFESIAADPDMTAPVALCLDGAKQELENAKASVRNARQASASILGKANW